MSQDQDQLQNLLEGLQSADANVRSAAEQLEARAREQQGYGEALVKFILTEQLNLAHRHMAALLLKSFINNHWDKDSTTFRDPIVSDQEKDTIRQSIAQGLAAQDTKLRTAVAMSISSIAKWDYPSDWPALLPGLLRAIGSQDSLHLVSGALSCLAMFADDLDEDHIIQVIPALFPHLLNVLRTPSYGQDLQLEALKTFNGIVHICLEASGPQYKEAQAAVLPHLEGWCRQFCQILTIPLSEDSQTLISMKAEVLKILTYMFGSLGKILQQAVQPILRCCFSTFSESLAIYQQVMVINSQDQDDSEGIGDEISNLVIQMFELLICVAGSKTLRQILKGSISDLAQMTLAYMQITRVQEAEWSEDVNQMINDEDDLSFSVRSSACLFLDEMSENFPEEIFEYFKSSLHIWLSGANDMKEQGEQNFWRIKEAALLAVQSLADEIVQNPGAQDFIERSGLRNSLMADLRTDSPPFLAGRSLIVASKLTRTLGQADLQNLINLIGMSLGQPCSSVLQICACQALSHLCGLGITSSFQAHMQSFYTGLIALLGKVQEEALQQVLETLKSLIKLDSNSAVQWQPHITPPVLQIWALKFSDPCTVMDCVEIFEHLASAPGTAPQLQATVVPVLKSIISKGKGSNHPVLIEGAVDLAATLVRDSPLPAIQIVHEQLSRHVIDLMCSQDDPGIIQSCCEFLRILIRCGGEQILSQGGADPGQIISYIFEVLQRLLSPEMGDSAPMYIGQVLNALLRKFPEHTLKQILTILPSILRKLVDARSSPLIISLLSVCCELVLVDAKQLLDYLVQTKVPGTEKNGLEALLQIWIERQLEFSGRDQIRLSCAALSSLLVTRHPALTTIQVKGKRLDINSVVRTRAKAQASQESWQYVPVGEKIASLLAQALLEEDDSGESGLTTSGSEDCLEEGNGFEHVKSPSKDTALGLTGIPKAVVKSAMEDGESSSRSLTEEGSPWAGHSIDSVISHHLKLLSREDPMYAEALCKTLPDSQQQAFREACSS